MTVYAHPGQPDAKVEFKSRYEHFIGGKWTPPVKGQYFENITPVTGKVFTEVGADLGDSSYVWDPNAEPEQPSALQRLVNVLARIALLSERLVAYPLLDLKRLGIGVRECGAGRSRIVCG